MTTSIIPDRARAETASIGPALSATERDVWATFLVKVALMPFVGERVATPLYSRQRWPTLFCRSAPVLPKMIGRKTATEGGKNNRFLRQEMRQEFSNSGEKRANRGALRAAGRAGGPVGLRPPGATQALRPNPLRLSQFMDCIARATNTHALRELFTLVRLRDFLRTWAWAWPGLGAGGFCAKMLCKALTPPRPNGNESGQPEKVSNRESGKKP